MPRPRSVALLVSWSLLLVTLVPLASVGAQSPMPSAPTFDTSGWTRASMPVLGFDVLLPPTFERVTADPTTAVPSIASIDERDPQTANALIAASQHIQQDGGLFDGFGLWSVEPATLLQLGILAGQPYRVAADKLQGIVEQSVIERASDLSDPVIQAVRVPAGEGFLTSYLDASDLSQHREFHLRTPTGRYLILASTYPGIADTTTEAMIDAVARSIAPIPGSAGERPAPDTSPGPGSALEATLPDRVEGVELTRRSLSGEDLVSSTDSAAGTIAGELGQLVSAPGDVTLALAVPAKGATPLRVSAYRLAGATVDEVQSFVDAFPASVWSSDDVAGRSVRVSVTATDGTRTWLRVTLGTDGVPVLYQVDAGSEALGQAAIRGLP